MSANAYLDTLEHSIQAERQKVAHHPLYGALATLEDVCYLAEHHIFAVWDFMSLLKFLQAQLTCVRVPWVPPANLEAARWVNEIVLGEESDELPGGSRSHFQLYLDAMDQMGASTENAKTFVQKISQGTSMDQAFDHIQAPDVLRNFVQSTFRPIRNEDLPGVASSFALGREEVIPLMFQRLVEELAEQHPERLTLFRLYLERHIELDGDDHGPAARRLLASCCGEDPEAWACATQAAQEALRARVALWDGILKGLPSRA